MEMLLVLLLLLLVAAAPAQAAELVTVDTPSKNVAGELHANVLLPDGYDKERRYPVLFLLHGVGDAYDTWAKPDRGDIE